jgi:hypothetical protein
MINKSLKQFFVWALLPLISTIFFNNLQAQSPIRKSQMIKSFKDLPFYFEANKGQTKANIKYRLKLGNKNVYFTTSGILYQNILEKTKGKECRIKVENIWLKFLGINETIEIQGLDESEATFNYFRGNNPQNWLRGVPAFHKIVYKNLYPNIDLTVSVDGGKVEYNYLVKKGGDIKDIRLKFEGVKHYWVNEKGELKILTAKGVLDVERPLSYQLIDGRQIKVKSYYEIHGSVENAYLVFNTETYNKNSELTIKSVETASSSSPMVYSTYLGGTEDEFGYGIAVDEKGYTYVTGYTESGNFPTTSGTHDRYFNGVYDVFVTKINPDGTSLVYSTYLGGNKLDHGYGIGLDDHGNAFVTGYTESTNFPTTPGAYNITSNGGGADGFVTKINPSGTDLSYSTYLGGSDHDYGYGIAVGLEGKVYVTGYTDSDDFPTTAGAYDRSFNGGSYYGDAFVTKLNSLGTSLVYSTYLGGTGNESGTAIALDSSENAFVTGSTTSDDFPISTSAFDDSQNGSTDVFVTKIKSTGASLIYSTYVGGSHRDFAQEIAVLGSSAYITGYTESENYPTTSGAYDTSLGGQFDGFITKLGSKGMNLGYSTYLGGSDFDYCYGIDVDGSGNALVTGTTESDDFPTTSGGYDTSLDGSKDAFITELDSSGAVLNYSTFLGGTSSDNGRGVVLDGHGNACLIGYTGSNDFPTTSGAYDTSHNGGYDSFVVKFNTDILLPLLMVSAVDLTFGATTTGDKTPAQKFRISNAGGGTLNWTVSKEASWLSCTPTSGTGAKLVSVSVDPTGLLAGQYTDTITISAPNTIGSPKTLSVSLIVHKPHTSATPFGEFATPLDGSTVRNSIPVTGWVLDDIGVESVKIYRGEANNPIYIGDAVFVEGARPDVQQSYPGFPMNHKAGWGYMMLTHFLPGGGNGIFKLHAIAKDKEGHQVTLGTKIINIDNANAIKPFGAIDSPVQGGIASGSNFINWGWVLTPQPNRIPIDGSTIKVFVDGVNLGHPNYNFYRKDIANLFPNYANSDGAVGYFSLDTTKYGDGVHTIQWVATDTGGNTDGIGSRYFNVENASNDILGSGVRIQMSEVRENLSNMLTDESTPVFVYKGFNRGNEPERVEPGRNKIYFVSIRELEPLEIEIAQEAIDVSGYHLIGNRLGPLPAGSFLNKNTKIFNWMPGPGFLGYFQLVFIEKFKNGTKKVKFVSINIEPKFLLELPKPD